MNLLEVKPIETITVNLRDPNSGDYLVDKDGKQVSITLKGMHTDSFQAELNKQRHEAARNEKRNVILTPQQERINNAKLYASVTISWEGVDGVCSKESAQSLYEPESMSWLRGQLSEALVEHAQSLKK